MTVGFSETLIVDAIEQIHLFVIKYALCQMTIIFLYFWTKCRKLLSNPLIFSLSHDKVCAI